MSRFCVIVLLIVVWQRAEAQPALPESFREEVRKAQNLHFSVSASSQFIVHDAPTDYVRPMGLSPSLASNYARLEPALLAVSCERVKAALLGDLGAPDAWQGRVAIFLHRAYRLDETIVIGSTVNDGEWSYYMNLPDTVERGRLISALTSVILLEIANRNSMRSAEIPAWLAQGLAREISRERMDALIVEPPEKGNHGIRSFTDYFDGTKTPALELARESLLTHPPLSLEELSWPRDGQETDEGYQSSAQLLICRLLELDDGRQCLRQMIQELPRYLNWQISFLDAFRSHFANQRDLEKWWDLGIVSFTGRDPAQTWSHAESWQKLDEIVHTSAEVRTSPDELPLHTEVPLQSVIGDWGYLTQRNVLEEKIRVLGLLRNAASPEMVGLVDGYLQVLDNYVKDRERSGNFRSATVAQVLGPDRTALDAIQQLNALDAEREAMRNGPYPGGETASNGSVTH